MLNNTRKTNVYKIVLEEMRSWEGTLELHGTSGTDMFGRERRWSMCAYEHWAERIAAKIIEANDGFDI